jgi:hypothetical protein
MEEEGESPVYRKSGGKGYVRGAAEWLLTNRISQSRLM